MSLCKEKIEHWGKPKAGKHKWRKNQMNRYMRRLPISDDDIGFKRGRKPIRSWEF